MAVKKKGLVALVAAAMIFLSGCTRTHSQVDTELTVNEDGSMKESMFVCVERSMTWMVVYHKESKVMYAVSNVSGGSGYFTLLVNPDGTPMIWED